MHTHSFSQELDEKGDETKFSETILSTFHDEDELRDKFLGLLATDPPRYQKPEVPETAVLCWAGLISIRVVQNEWWASLLRLIHTLEKILPETYLSKVNGLPIQC